MGSETRETSADKQATRLSDVFNTLWKELRSTLGSAATAALLRRAIALSRPSCPNLGSVQIEKSGRDYIYHIPSEADESPDARRELQVFMGNVFSVLTELTGKILVRHLCENPVISSIYEAR